jgi:hypothetical protein
VSFFHQGAGGIDDAMAGIGPRPTGGIGGTVGGDDDCVSGRTAALAQVAAAHAERLQVNGDEGIVYQFTEHSDRFKGGSVVSVAQGVADAEAHAEVGSESDFHGLDFGFFAWL